MRIVWIEKTFIPKYLNNLKKMRKFIFFVLISYFIHINLMSQEINRFPVQTKIENGIIEGFKDSKTGLQQYFGIPLPNHRLVN